MHQHHALLPERAVFLVGWADEFQTPCSPAGQLPPESRCLSFSREQHCVNVCVTDKACVQVHMCGSVHVYMHGYTLRRALGTQPWILYDTWNQACSTSFVVQHLWLASLPGIVNVYFTNKSCRNAFGSYSLLFFPLFMSLIILIISIFPWLDLDVTRVVEVDVFFSMRLAKTERDNSLRERDRYRFAREG